MRWILLLMIVLPLLFGCSALTDTDPDINLDIVSFSADESYFTLTLTNEGADPAGQFNVYYVLDELYVEVPENTFATLSDLAAGTEVSFQVPNQLSSSDGLGGHCVTLYVDYVDDVAETNEGDNKYYAYYYDGAYETEYDYIRSKTYSWVENIRDTVQENYEWPATGGYNMHLLDTVTSSDDETMHGLRTTRTINGANTSVILFNLASAHNGYNSFNYDSTVYEYNSSREVVCHEYTHAFHRQYIVDNSSVSNWNDVPTWFKEGLAVYTAGQGLKRVRYYAYRLKHFDSLSESGALSEILEGVCGSSSHEHDNDDYAGDFLAICYINSQGSSKLRSIIQDNASGMELETAIVNNLSSVSSWSDFKSKVETYAEEYFADYVQWSKVDAGGINADGIDREPEPDLVD
ncbi:MAG: CARDB domain-containing protein [bacterium]